MFVQESWRITTGKIGQKRSMVEVICPRTSVEKLQPNNYVSQALKCLETEWLCSQ